MTRKRASTLTRRRFSSCAAAFAARSTLPAAGPHSIPIGVQLFSLRRQCEKHLAGTLASVRQIGFEGVEFAGYYGRNAPELLSLLSDTGLRCCGAHTPLSEFTASWFNKAIDFQHALGNTYVIVPDCRQSIKKPPTAGGAPSLF